MSNLPWFRMYTEAVDDAKLGLLAFEDRWHFFALLCCKGQGLIDGSPLMRRKLAVKLGIDIRTLEEVARRLAEVGLINADTMEPIAWDKRQMPSDSSAARVAAFRNKKKQECNVTVTDKREKEDIDLDSDLDLEKEGEKTIPPSIQPSIAGSCCRSMVKNGISSCNPHHPTLLALIQAGATEQEFTAAARTAKERGKGSFNYVIGMVKSQREEAAALILHQGRIPNKQELLEQSNRAATAGWVPPELRSQKNAN